MIHIFPGLFNTVVLKHLYVYIYIYIYIINNNEKMYENKFE